MSSERKLLATGPILFSQKILHEGEEYYLPNPTKYITALLAARLQEKGKHFVPWHIWHAVSPHAWVKSRSQLLWRSNNALPSDDSWVNGICQLFGIDFRSLDRRHFIGGEDSPKRPANGKIAEFWEEGIEFVFKKTGEATPRVLNTDDEFLLFWRIMTKGSQKEWEDLIRGKTKLPDIPTDRDSNEYHHSLLKSNILYMYRGWSPRKNRDKRLASLSPANRSFARWCRSIVGIVDLHHHPQARLKIDEFMEVLNAANLDEGHLARQQQLAQWMVELSTELGRDRSGWVRPPAHVSEAEARDIAYELQHDNAIEPVDGASYFSGGVRMAKKSQEVKVLMLCEGVQRVITVRVDEITGCGGQAGVTGVSYPHPAFALAVTAEDGDLQRGMDEAVAVTLDTQGRFHQGAFRWALVDYHLLEHLTDGSQISAAVLVACSLLTLKSERYKFDSDDLNIWVQIRPMFSANESGFTYAEAGPGMGAVLQRAEEHSRELRAKGKFAWKNLILAAETDNSANAVSFHSNTRLARIGGEEITPDHLDMVLYTAMKQDFSPNKNATNTQPYFVGRKEALAKLMRALTSPRATAVSITSVTGVAIRGIGGIGKSELARELVKRLREQNGAQYGGEDSTLWIDLKGHVNKEKGRSTEDLLMEICQRYFDFPDAKFKELFEKARVEGEKDTGRVSMLYLKKLKEAYLQHLEAHAKIVVLDNARDDEQIRWFLPEEEQATLAVFIITSRQNINHELIDETGREKLGYMSPDEVREWVDKYPSASGLKNFIPKLWQVTGGLPLAISLVLSAWREIKHDARRFLENIELKQMNAQLPADPSNEDRDYHNLRSCFELSASLLEEKRPGARDAFLKLSVFEDRFDAPAAASVCDLQDPAPEDACDDAQMLIALFVAANLVEEDQIISGRYWLHDLIRKYASKELAERPATKIRFARHYAGLTAYLGKRFRQGGEHSVAAAKLFLLEESNLSRGRDIALAAYKSAPPSDKEEHAELVVAYAALAMRVCDLAQAAMERKSWLKDALDLAERHFSDRALLLARLQIAYGLALRHLNETSDAIRCMEKALRDVGESNRDITKLEKLSVEGDAHGNWGNLLIDLANKVKDTRKRKGGVYQAMDSDHDQEPYESFYPLEEGRNGSALDKYRALYEATERHHNTALECSQILERKAGLDRSEGQDFGNLAIVYAEYGLLKKADGNLKEAQSWFDKAREKYEARNASANRPAVSDYRGHANGLGNLGNLHCSMARSGQGDYDEALNCQKQAFDLQEKAGNKRGMAATRGNAAIVHYCRRDEAQADLQKGDELTQESIQLFKEIADTVSAEKSEDNQKAAANGDFEPKYHLADRYGKITDALPKNFMTINSGDVERSRKLCVWWHERLNGEKIAIRCFRERRPQPDGQ